MSNSDPYWAFRQSGTAKSSRQRIVLAPTPNPGGLASQNLIVGFNNGWNNGANQFPPQQLGWNEFNTFQIAEFTLTNLGTEGPLGSPLIVDIQVLPYPYTGSYESIFTSQSQMPTLQPGQHESVIANQSSVTVNPNDFLQAYVVQVGSTQPGNNVELSILVFGED